MKKLLVLVCCALAFTGCTSVTPRPIGSLLFYVKITNGAFSGPPKGETGVFFYSEGSPSAPIVVAYDMREGRPHLFSGGNSDETSSLMRDLAAIDFIPFDFHAEVESATARQMTRVRATGENSTIRITMDGAEFEIGFNGPKGKFMLREWNPGPKIEDLASDSENIGKLNKLIGRFAEHYGRSRFSL